jgi:excisionase family DNA binding protein
VSPKTAKKYITLAEGADLLDVHPRTIRRWIASGRLTGYRAGSHLIRVDPDELDAILSPIPTVIRRPS